MSRSDAFVGSVCPRGRGVPTACAFELPRVHPTRVERKTHRPKERRFFSSTQTLCVRPVSSFLSSSLVSWFLSVSSSLSLSFSLSKSLSFSMSNEQNHCSTYPSRRQISSDVPQRSTMTSASHVPAARKFHPSTNTQNKTKDLTPAIINSANI